MILILALAVMLAIFFVSVSILLMIVGPTILLKPRRRLADFYRALHQPILPTDAGIPFEPITVEVDDTLKLDCWLVKAAHPARGTIIYLHGVGDCKIDGIRFARLMHEHDYNIFLYDSRCHGNSGGKFCTYGFYEKFDLTLIINYLFSRDDLTIGKIGLFGTSMGAAVALQAASIDKRIAAVVAENSFATLRTIFDDYQKRIIKLPFHFLRNLVIKRSEVLAAFKAREVSPLDSISGLHIPILLVCGTADHLIDSRYTMGLYEKANQPKELFAIDGAKHNDTWKIGGVAYEARLVQFFDRRLA